MHNQLQKLFPWSSNISNMWASTDYQVRSHDTILTRNSQQQYCNLLCVCLCLSLSQTLLAAHGFLSLTTHNKHPLISSCVYIINYCITTPPFPEKLVYHQVLCSSSNMKVLSWMYRKSRKDITEPLKKLSFGDSCSCLSAQLSFDEHQHHLEPSYTSAHTKQTKRACSRYSNGLKANEEEVSEEESAIMMSELFHGFLTIGTLGFEPTVAEPTTPKFAKSCKSAYENETLATETGLKLINVELEKFLEAEAKDVDYDSSEMSSFVSTITLSGYQIEETDAEEDKNMVTCPLQQYLFNSSIECPEIGEEMKKEKRSLRKLFENDYNSPEQQKEQNKGGTATEGTCTLKFMKKMLRKIHVTSTSSKASANDHAAGNASTKRKVPKVLRLLQKRIHPEISIFPGQKLTKSHKYEDRTKHQDRAVTILEKGIHKFPNKTILKDSVISVNNNQESPKRIHTDGTGGHWIKTDADYLVLEL